MPEQIANHLGHKGPKSAENFSYALQVLTGISPVQPGKGGSQQAYHAAKRFLKTPLSTETRKHLEKIVRDYDPKEMVPPIASPYNWPEALNVPGVYAYSYPHYIKYAYSPSDGRTLIKVGYSGSSVAKRMDYQIEQTGVPEDLQLLRVYRSNNAKMDEKRFQAVLENMGHKHETATGGTEWFLTSTSVLDAIAGAYGLQAVDLDSIS